MREGMLEMVEACAVVSFEISKVGRSELRKATKGLYRVRHFELSWSSSCWLRKKSEEDIELMQVD